MTSPSPEAIEAVYREYLSRAFPEGVPVLDVDDLSDAFDAGYEAAARVRVDRSAPSSEEIEAAARIIATQAFYAAREDEFNTVGEFRTWTLDLARIALEAAARVRVDRTDRDGLRDEIVKCLVGGWALDGASIVVNDETAQQMARSVLRRLEELDPESGRVDRTEPREVGEPAGDQKSDGRPTSRTTNRPDPTPARSDRVEEAEQIVADLASETWPNDDWVTLDLLRDRARTHYREAAK